MKHVQESLFQFNDHKFFKLLEGKQEKEDSTDDFEDKTSESEKDGMAIIKKLQDNFNLFETAANGKIIRYKEFWEDNKLMSEQFEETGKIYKMFDSDYVAGVLELPDAELGEDDIDDELSEINEGASALNETDEFKGFNVNDTLPEGEKEEEETEENIEGDEAKIEDTEENIEGDEAKIEDTEENIEGDENLGGEEAPNVENPEEDQTDIEGVGGNRFFVVFDMSKDQREEIYKSDSSSVIEAFEDFFENTFKGSIKAQIQKRKEKEGEIKKKIEMKEKEKMDKQKKEKLNKFLK